MQTATGQTIQSVKDTFGKVVVCNAADGGVIVVV